MMENRLEPVLTSFEPGQTNWRTWLEHTHHAARPWSSSDRPLIRDESWKYTRKSAFNITDGITLPTPVIRTAFDHRTNWQPLKRTRQWSLMSLACAYSEHADLVTTFFGKMAGLQTRQLTALNTGAFRDGIFLYIPPGRCLSEPIELTLMLSPGTTAAFPRVLILLGAGANAHVMERHVWTDGLSQPPSGVNPPSRMINSITEIHLGEQAALTHYLEQTGDPSTRAVSLTAAHLSTDSTYQSFQYDGCGFLLRHEHDIMLKGRGSRVQLDVLSLLSKGEHHDHQTRLVHAAPATQSTQRIRSVVGARATSIYGGHIRISPEAKGSEAAQNNHHLLLDSSARAMSRPELEIGVDDVRCTHGATSGELNQDTLFYLRSRGIDQRQARHILITGFTEEFLAGIPSETIRAHWRSNVDGILAKLEES